MDESIKFTLDESIKFTIVVLGYETELYLPRALSSIDAQTYRNFDVICVVEESRDESLEVCRKWADRGNDCIVISRPKSGSGSLPRNYTIDHAKGSYLVFVDGDDWLEPFALQKLAGKLGEIGEVDVLSFAAFTMPDGNDSPQARRKITNFRAFDEKAIFSGLDAIRKIGRNGGAFHGYTWLNCYRTAFLRAHALYQKKGVIMEDAEWMARVLYMAKRVAYMDEPLYIYRRRQGSALAEASSRIIYNIAENFISIAIFAEQNSVPQDIAAVWANQWLSLLFWFMYAPVSSRKIADRDRREVVAALFGGQDGARIRHICCYASRMKRIGLFFVRLVRYGWQLPAKLFFRAFYYPLLKLR